MFEIIEPTVLSLSEASEIKQYLGSRPAAEVFKHNYGRKITHEFKAGFGHAIVSGKQCATFYRPQSKKPVIPCPGDVLAPWLGITRAPDHQGRKHAFRTL